MSDEPDDLRDQRGRMNRIVVSVLVGVACGAIAYAICWGLAKPDELPAAQAVYDGRAGGYKFVYYVTGLAFAAGLGITMLVLDARAAKRWRARQIPQAKIS